MSDSGRVLGDCKHGHTREWCVDCLRNALDAADARIAELEVENARLRHDLDAAIQVAVDAGLGLPDVLTRPLASAVQIAELRAALAGLEYYDAPGRFCDHAAEPCPRCEAAREALKETDR